MTQAEPNKAVESPARVGRRFSKLARVSFVLFVLTLIFHIYLDLWPAQMVEEGRLARLGNIQIFAQGGFIQIHHGEIMSPVAMVLPIQVHEKPVDVFFLGFGFVYRIIPHPTGQEVIWTVTLPIVFFVLLFALLPSWQWVGFIRRRKDATTDYQKCGYDLRAGADQCPECGTPINRLE